MTDEEAEARALIDRLQPGELLASDYENDSYYYARLIEGPSGRGKIIERCYISDSGPGGVFDRISHELEARTERGELAYGPYCSHWQLPSDIDQKLAVETAAQQARDEAEGRALLDRLQPGEALEVSHQEDGFFYVARGVTEGGGFRFIEGVMLGENDDPAFVNIMDEIARRMKARHDMGKRELTRWEPVERDGA
jgi:hypothetical protein